MRGDPPRTGAAPGGLVAALAWTGGALFALSLGYFLYGFLFLFDAAAGGPVWRPVVADLVLFSAFALHHSLLARTRFKKALRRVTGVAVERSLYTWAASVMFIAVCVLWRHVPGVLYALEPPWAWIGYTTQAAGIGLAALGSRAVDVLDLAGIRPVLSARSGRAPKHVPLVTSGAYALVRHPIYLGWALFVFGTPVMTATRFVFAVISTAYLAVAIPWEEGGLVKTFGTEYERYQARVRWRMLPYVY